MIFRKIYHTIQKELDNNLIILLVGARQVGKTTLLKQIKSSLHNKTSYFINLEDPDIKSLLNKHPNNIFKITGSKPSDKQYIFIDEIQYLNDPSNFLKYIFDEYKDCIKLIVSGSSSFYIDQKFKDSLTGRKRVFNIYTLDFEEFLLFKNEEEISRNIFINKNIPLLQKQKIEDLFLEYITYGGYPEIVLYESNERKKERLKDYAFDYIKKDIYESNVHDQDKFLSLLKILANQVGELVNMNELSKTLKLSQPTVEKYIYIMQKSFHVAMLKPYYTNIRKELTKMPKVYFYDLGIRNILLGNFDNIYNRYDKGQYFENIIFREFLFRYGIDDIKFWRTQDKNEVDFIIQGKNAYETKFNENLINKNKYKVFNKLYPDIKFDFITFDIENVIF